VSDRPCFAVVVPTVAVEASAASPASLAVIPLAAAAAVVPAAAMPSTLGATATMVVAGAAPLDATALGSSPARAGRLNLELLAQAVADTACIP